MVPPSASSSSSSCMAAATSCSSANAVRKASTVKIDFAASSLPTTSSSIIAARRTRSMTSSKFKSFGSLTSRNTEKLAYFFRASSIAGRCAPRRPRTIAPRLDPMACTKTYLVRRKRPCPKPMRRIPNITMSVLVATQFCMPSIESSPPATRSWASGSACRNTQFHGPSGSPTARSASRPVVKMSLDEWPGTERHEPVGGAKLCAPIFLAAVLEASIWRSYSFIIHWTENSAPESVMKYLATRSRISSAVTSACLLTSTEAWMASLLPRRSCFTSPVSSFARPRAIAGQSSPLMCMKRIFWRRNEPSPSSKRRSAHCTEVSCTNGRISSIPASPAPITTAGY
mmetsp:Transcript_93339/g.217023  ORF Transcript_93339/g.217023 Transcript_93339/m.217023 type:complete len:342 (+) Transcript_93339:1011-2036(+)